MEFYIYSIDMTRKENDKVYGLIGKNIDYSFSRRYFSEKFEREKIANCSYINFELSSIEEFPSILGITPRPSGLNVTIPYKKSILPYLDFISDEAQAIEAVNTVVWDKHGNTIGHNTDHSGFKKALLEQVEKPPKKAFILGTGGASGAVHYVLKQLECEVIFVSRTPQKEEIHYKDLTQKLFQSADLIVNTTPLGTFPDIKNAPPLPYDFIEPHQLLFDLIYNPTETTFLRIGKENGAKTCNGYDMLVYQAENSWALWNQ